MADPEQQNPRTDESEALDERERRKRSARSAAAARMTQQSSWVDQQIRVAMARGEFDELPGAGKPIPGLGGTHDPDWWLKKLVERERIALLPPSLELRREDGELDARLDRITVEKDVRREVDDFNARIIRARYLPPEGPPLITMPRDVDETVEAWRTRRAAVAAARTATATAAGPPPRRRWWRRSRT